MTHFSGGKFGSPAGPIAGFPKKRLLPKRAWEYAMKSEKKLIVSDPAVMMGKPVIAGTRITVEHILEKLAAGETVEAILDAHPRLTREAVLAALAFAAGALRADVVYPFEGAAG